MANTAISDIADRIRLSAGGEILIPALGNGSLKPGAPVSRNVTTNKVQGVNPGTTDLFEGIILPRYDSDVDTAIVDTKPCDLVVPVSGKVYAVLIADPGAAKYRGAPLVYGNGVFTLAGADMDDDNIVANLHEDVANGDTVAKIRWR